MKNQTPEIELPRIENSSKITFECFGVKVGIETNRVDLLKKIYDSLPVYSKIVDLDEVEHLFSVQACENDSQETAIFYNGAEKSRHVGYDWIFDNLRSAMRQRVAEYTSERVFVHAGVVSWKNTLILLPARGFGGKTTLTAELVKAGATYYSDEFAILDENGIVYPYPKPLSMRRRNDRSGAQTEYDVEFFGGVQGIQPLPAGMVVITEFKPYSRWQPEVLSAGQGVIEILKHTNSSLRQPKMALKVLQKLAIKAKIIKSKRGDAARAARAILRECEFEK